jgi:aldose 1-epimerase
MNTFFNSTWRPAALVLLALTLTACQGSPNVKIDSQNWGATPDGTPVKLFTLENDNGLICKITNYGAIVTEMHTPDRDGKMADIVLGFDDIEGYTAGHPYFGSIVGRCANRIALGKFKLDGKNYSLATNNDPNHLHGGDVGYDKRVWDATPIKTEIGPALVLALYSPDGEEGYPGNLTATVTYTLTHNDELRVDMTATTDAATVVNLAHHTYWNLGGHDSGDILGHEMTFNADAYTPVDSTLIPTGKIAKVAGTPFDFRKAKTIGKDFAELPAKGDDPGGYDHNIVLREGEPGQLNHAVTAHNPATGRSLTITTDQPGIQFYTGKGGAVYHKNNAFCLETQHFPDSINQPNFASTVLRPGETYIHTMVHKFSAE